MKRALLISLGGGILLILCIRYFEGPTQLKNSLTFPVADLTSSQPTLSHPISLSQKVNSQTETSPSRKVLRNLHDPRMKSVGQLLDDERWDAAAIALMEILKSEPNHEEALLAMGYLYARDKKYSEQGIQMLEKVLRLNPQNDSAMGELLSLFEEGKVRSLSKRLEEAYDQNPDSMNLAAGLGRIKFLEGSVKESIPLLEKASHDEVYAESSYHSLIDAYLATGDSAKVAETYSRLIEFQRQSLDKIKSHGGSEAQRLERSIVSSQLGLASSLIAIGDWTTAEQILKDIQQTSPKEQGLEQLLAQVEREKSS